MRQSFLLLFLWLSVIATAQEHQIVLKTPTGDLDGTLTLPDKQGAVPVVLIVAGSGPTDRNCNSNAGLESNAYKYLADALRHEGIASVRYDKRGVGQSDMGMNSREDILIETYANDVKLWIRHLSADRRFSRLVLAGHSEGSLLCMLALNETGKAHGFISIAGAGRPVDIVLKEQLSHIHESARMVMFDIIDQLKSGDTVQNIPPIFYNLFHPSQQPFLISWMKYDPAQQIKNLKVPALVLQGSTDIQVKVADAELLGKAKPDAQVKIIHNMSHVLKTFENTERKAQIEHYSNTTAPLHPELVPEIVSFVRTL